MLLNEMYTSCAYIKSKFLSQFDNLANKIKMEKCFVSAPSLEKFNLNPATFQMKPDEKLTAMITTTE
jgi:hypothetical protein